MARPNKNGVDYFPLDCQMDDEIKYIEAEFGLDGFGMVVKLWQKIYGDKGYYCSFPRTVRLMFARSIGKGVNFVDEVIARCTEYGIFDRDLLKKYRVLTSEGIQKRYAKMTERRNSLKILGRYLLISAPENWVIVDNNSVNADKNSENVDKNSESKVNTKSKSKITTTTTNESACARVTSEPSVYEVAKYLGDSDPYIDGRGMTYTFNEAQKFCAYNAKRNWDCLPDWQKAADLWIARVKDKEGK